MALPGQTNGVHEPRSQSEAEDVLSGKPLTLDYRPQYSGALASLMQEDGGRFGDPWQHLRDVEQMVVHPDVKNPYGFYKSGISNVEFRVKAATEEQAEEAHGILVRCWERHLAQMQLCYDYGWCGYEPTYNLKKGFVEFDSLIDLHPFDCWVLTKKGQYRGFRLKGTLGTLLGGSGKIATAGQIDLWGPGKWPAKGLWLAHNRRWDRWYGRSQLRGAWRPWKRLAARDGAEDVVDGAVYRRGYQGPIIRYPADSFKKASGGEMDYEAARNESMQISQQAKAGFSIALPNDRDQHGEYKWGVEWPTSDLTNVAVLLDYEESLQKQISRGVDVPPEVLEASETGSGYSGRKIPIAAFYGGQTENARNFTRSIVEQLVIPILQWNHGDDAWCEAEVEVVLPAILDDKRPEQGGPGGVQPPQAEPPPAQGEPPAPDGQQPEQGGGGLAQALQQTGAAQLSVAAEPARTWTLSAAAAAPAEPAHPEAVLDAAASSVRALCRSARQSLLSAVSTAPRELTPQIVRRWAAEWQPKLAEAFSQVSLAASLEGMRSLSGLLDAEVMVPPAEWIVHEAANDLPLVKEAAARLSSMGLLALPSFLTAKGQAHAAGTASALQQTNEVQARVRQALSHSIESGGTLAGFRRDLARSLDGTALAAHESEAVFRTNVMSAYSDGQERLLSDPTVGDLFPFRAYHATRDSRVRPHHLAMERSGIGGTNVYLASDPVWQLWRPPSEINCRCNWTPVSVAEAARRGVKYAQDWLALGRKPSGPEPWVAMPARKPDAQIAAARGVELSAATEGGELALADAIMRMVDGYELSGAGEWQPYEGPRGGKGWRRGDEIVYGERPGEGEGGGAAAHPLAGLKASHGIDLTHLTPEQIEVVRQALAPAAKPTPAPRAKAETPPHVAAAAQKMSALADAVNEKLNQRGADARSLMTEARVALDALDLDKLTGPDLQALARMLDVYPQQKNRAGYVDAIRRVVLEPIELFVGGAG